MKPEVSVIIPIFNSSKYLVQTIESILTQSFKSWELLIFDDGSTDNTMQIRHLYTDRRIKFFTSEKHLGIARLRQKGISYAKGRYIALIDADDLMTRDRLSTQRAFLENNPDIALVGTWFRRIDKTGKKTLSLYKPVCDFNIVAVKLFFGNCFAQPTVMIRRKIIEKYGYRETYKEASDYDLWMRISKDHKIVNLPEVLTYYRVHSDNASSTDTIKRNIAIASKKIFSNRFKKVGLIFSKNELKLHSDLESKKNFHYNELDSYEKWLNKLFLFNQRKNVFDSEVFNYFLSQYWFRICALAANSGLSAYSAYRRSELSNLSTNKFKLKALLFILCILRLNNSFGTYSYPWWKLVNETNFKSTIKFLFISLPIFIGVKSTKALFK